MAPVCKVSRSLVASACALLTLLAKLLAAVAEHAALPVTATLVVTRRVAEDLVLDAWGPQPLLEDAFALAPFFFGLACLENMRKKRPSQPTWGTGIYPLCL